MQTLCVSYSQTKLVYQKLDEFILKYLDSYELEENQLDGTQNIDYPSLMSMEKQNVFRFFKVVRSLTLSK